MNGTRLIRLECMPHARLENRSDDELMVLAQAGAHAAFAVLVERHAVRLVQTCSRFVDDAAAGVDLAQQTWVAVWQARARYQSGGKFVVWLLTVARNHCRNELRERRVARRHTIAASDLGESPSPEQIDAPLAAEQRRRVRAALDSLPDAMREALLLRFAEDLHYEEMADVVGADVSTLRSRVHHGLRRLRRILEKKR